MTTDQIKILVSNHFNLQEVDLKRTSKKKDSNKNVIRVFNNRYEVNTGQDDVSVVSMRELSYAKYEGKDLTYAIGIEDVDGEFVVGMTVQTEDSNNDFNGEGIEHILKKFNLKKDNSTGVENTFIRTLDDCDMEAILIGNEIKHDMNEFGATYDSYYWGDAGNNELNNYMFARNSHVKFAISIGIPSTICDSCDKDHWRKACRVHIECYDDLGDYGRDAIEPITDKYNMNRECEHTSTVDCDTEQEALDIAKNIKLDAIELGLVYDGTCAENACTELERFLTGDRNHSWST